MGIDWMIRPDCGYWIRVPLWAMAVGAVSARIANPAKKRPDFPTMPPQDHLSEPMRQLVAEYMLALTN